MNLTAIKSGQISSTRASRLSVFTVSNLTIRDVRGTKVKKLTRGWVWEGDLPPPTESGGEGVQPPEAEEN